MTNHQRTAIVTGGSRGIGREVAARLSAQGLSVVIDYAQDTDAAEAVIAELRAAGGKAIAVRADVADEAAIEALFDAAEQTFGGVDVVVHAAAITGPYGPVADFDLDDFDQILHTNIRGTFVVAQQAARRLRPGGALITFSSSATRYSRPGSAVYTLTKGAVESLTLLLARELRGRDITVNTVAPGPIETELFERFLEGRDAARAELASASPMGRLGLPDDIAEVITFLAGPARWINGQVIYVNGGAI